jgi:hypothetical protein
VVQFVVHRISPASAASTMQPHAAKTNRAKTFAGGPADASGWLSGD